MGIPCIRVPQGRLKAATLLESVLALGLLSAAMSLAVLMHFRTLTTARGQARLVAWSATERVLAGIAEGMPVDRAWDAPQGLVIAAEETSVGMGLRSVHVVCSNGTGVLLERRTILPAP